MFPHYSVVKVLAYLQALGVDFEQQALFYKKVFNNQAVSAMDYTGIEKKYHLIWLTNPAQPKEVKPEWMNNILHNLSKLDNLAEYELNLWVNCAWCIPKSVSIYKDIGFKIRNITEPGLSIHQGVFDEALQENNFGIASDYLRYKILQKEGGIYTDFNYQFITGPSSYLDNYSFVAPEFRLGYLFDNHIIAAKSGSKILKDTVTMIEQLQSEPAIFTRVYNNSKMHPESKTVYKTILPFVSSIMSNILSDGKGVFILPIDYKEPTSDMAKPSINKHSILLYSDDLANADEECSSIEEDLYLLFYNYMTNSICMEKALGFDMKGSKSWLPVAQLWHD